MYIERMCSIGPAGVFTGSGSLQQPDIVNGRMLCAEPDYKDIIPPMQLRRMSKPVRTGVAAAKLCLETFTDLSAINIGTAYGMLQDSENFLDKMIIQDEEMLNPTAFIQSTHNTVGGQIALSIRNNAPNMTYVHKGHSFESALLDTELMLAGKKYSYVLLGAVDECTDTSFGILASFGIYNSAVVAGEGAHFYLVSDRRSAGTQAKIEAFDMFTADDIAAALDRIKDFIAAQGQPSGSDVLLYGDNGSAVSGSDYAYIRSEIFNEQEAVPFKKYSGEYPTASGFAPAFAISLLHRCPAVWVVNNYGPYWSLYYLKKV